MIHLPAILLLGIITTYEDIRLGKIKNVWIISALIYAVGMYALTGVSVELFTNLLFATAVGYGLWHTKIWTAGDGKLFIAFAALTPLSVYLNGPIPWIPSLVLLINVFIPATLLFVVIIVLKAKMSVFKTLWPVAKKILALKNLLLLFLKFFALIWLTRSFLGLFGLESFTLIATFGVKYLIRKYVGEKSLYVFIFLGIIRIFFDKTLLTPSTLYELLLLVLLWRVIRAIYKGALQELGYELFSKDVPVKSLKPGMVMSDCIMKSDGKSKGEVHRYNGREYVKVPGGKKSQLKDEAEGLTAEHIKKIKAIGFKTVRISSTIPFSPFMFSGVLLTLLANGNILIIIINLLS